MKNGFYPALGTPLDEMGRLIPLSFSKQVDDQIEAGAAGLLVLGSMGIQPYIRNDQHARIARSAVETAKGRCPVMVGVMDNSVSRVLDRIDSLNGLKLDGVVVTAPYYYASSQEDLISFFQRIAAATDYPVYLYDLPSVTQTHITSQTVEALMKIDNIKGIKSGNLVTMRQLMHSTAIKSDFSILFSGLDVFDTAYQYGLGKNLDGMFSCLPALASKLYVSLENGEYEQASRYLNDILLLRDVFVQVGVFNGFSYAMNALGYEGQFAPDFMVREDGEGREKVLACMKQIGLL